MAEPPSTISFQSSNPSAVLVSLHAIRARRVQSDQLDGGSLGERRLQVISETVASWFGRPDEFNTQQLRALDSLSAAMAFDDPGLRLLADPNDDGLIQDDEWYPLLQYLDDHAMQQRDRLLEQFDSDGDRRYSPDEARIAARELGSLLDAVDQFAGIDLDFDGTLSSAEVADYFERHAGKDPTADLTGDGRVDNEDLSAFVDIIR